MLLGTEEREDCCQGEDCERVENEDCRAYVEEQLQPCLLNNDANCTLEAITSLYQTPPPSCPEVKNICPASLDIRTSLEATADMFCPATGPSERLGPICMICFLCCVG